MVTRDLHVHARVYMRDQLGAPLWSCVTCVYMRDQMEALSWSRVTCMYMRAQVEVRVRVSVTVPLWSCVTCVHIGLTLTLFNIEIFEIPILNI